MKRGDIYVVREAGSLASKPRPCLVVQTDSALSAPKFVTICPLTSVVGGLQLIRVAIAPDADNGLETVSEVEVDLISTVKAANFGPHLGVASPMIMRLVDDALRRWLDL